MEHDHSSHASASATAMPPSLHPEHGTWPGHVLPGSFFLIWSSWWLVNALRLYIQSSRQAPFRSRAWFMLDWGPARKIPLEPLLKVLLTFVGINAELWAGHTSYRNLYTKEGHFEINNLQDWQHSAMYMAFLISGLVDFIAYHSAPGALPSGIEHLFLGLAFVVEGLLFAFHLKGSMLDWSLHLLLVLLVLAAALVCFAEYRFPGNVVLVVLRAQLVMLQGIWFIQIAEILFRDRTAWLPDYHGSAMMVPVVFVTWVLLVSFATFCIFAGMRTLQLRRASLTSNRAVQLRAQGDKWMAPREIQAGDIEIAATFQADSHLH